MTLANDDSRNVLNGNTAPIEPSALPLMELRMTNSIPTVFATAIPLPFAPHHKGWATTAAPANKTTATAADDVLAMTVPPPFTPHPDGKGAATTRTASGGGIGRRVVRTNEPDGLLSVNMYTTACCPDGRREVRIMNFRIHARDAAGQAVAHALPDNSGDADWLLGYSYLTRVEVRTYPPGTANDAGMASTGGHPPTTHATPGYSKTTEAVVMGPDATHSQNHPDFGRSRGGKWCIGCGVCWGVICLILILLVILAEVFVALIIICSNPIPTFPPNMWPNPMPTPPPSLWAWPTFTPPPNVWEWPTPTPTLLPQ
jgi:hypothetical protein